MNKETAATSLYQLLGAPLFALIEAERYAAHATAEFIKEMGFEQSEPPKGKVTSGSDLPRRELGKLRTLSFKQKRTTSEGQAAMFTVEVPLLSILPIPALQIKEAELEFFVKIVGLDTQATVPPKVQLSANKTGAKVATSQENNEEKTSIPTESSLVSVREPHLNMKAMLGRGHPAHPLSPNSAFDMQVHIKIKVAQADPPAGLSRLFNLMEESISISRDSSESDKKP